MTAQLPSTATVSRDQALVNQLVGQRNNLMNEAANLAADLEVAQSQILAMGETILRLTGRVKELEDQYEPKPALAPSETSA